MPGPLEGVTVIDLTQIYNGPYAAFLMAQAGARVIKVEPPGGEHIRRRQAKHKATLLPFAMLNANKECVTLNLKSEAGLKLMLELVSKADVLVENFAAGVLERLGLGWDVLHKVNPRLIYASSTGFGSDGPYKNYPAVDLVVQALSGIIAATGYPDQPPVKAGGAPCDFLAATHLYSAIVTALFERARTGLGRAVEVSMLESVYMTLTGFLGAYHVGGKAQRNGNRSGGGALAPCNLYPAADGWIAVSCNNDKDWQAFIIAMGHPEAGEDPRFKTESDRVRNMDELDRSVGEWTSLLPKEEIFQRLLKARVSSAPIREVPEVIEDPHLHARGALKRIDHPEYGPMVVQTSPLRFRGGNQVPYRPSHALGADNREIYGRMLGLDEAVIEKYAAEGVI